ncbi:MAG TPA: T9SS type A sorting domain-containing protein [Candidatus Krumholzibacteria bacterium]|nr:T9SS type A sorting domain-containing protein [Candidatus Krumholzibacteria bacterium]
MRCPRISIFTVTVVSLLLHGAAVSATVVFSSDFESGLPAEISAPGAAIVGVQGWSGLGPPGNQFSGSFLRYTSQELQTTTLVLTNLPAHDGVDVAFLLAVIDSWDGTELLKIAIDGVEVFSHWFQIAIGDASSYVAPAGGLLSSGTQLGFTNTPFHNKDRAYDMAVEPVFSVPHTASTLTVTWYLGAVSGGAAENWQGGDDESWAIDNLRVEITGEPTAIGGTPSPLALTLLPNAPNPFSNLTTLRVGTPNAAEATLDVFDVAGHRVREERIPLTTGWQELPWTGIDQDGKPLPNGVYFYRIRSGKETRTHRFVITR